MRALRSDNRGESSPDGPKPGVQILVRVSPGREYLKVVLHEERVVGAMLIGDTELAETFENLILNRLPVGHLDLLDPALDLDDISIDPTRRPMASGFGRGAPKREVNHAVQALTVVFPT